MGTSRFEEKVARVELGCDVACVSRGAWAIVGFFQWNITQHRFDHIFFLYCFTCKCVARSCHSKS